MRKQSGTFWSHLHRSQALILPDPQSRMVSNYLLKKAGALMGDVPVDIIASVSTQMELLQGEAAGLQSCKTASPLCRMKKIHHIKRDAEEN